MAKNVNYFDSRFTNAQLATMLKATYKELHGTDIDTSDMGRCTLAAKLEDLDRLTAALGAMTSVNKAVQ